jgi:hypothetical protein
MDKNPKDDGNYHTTDKNKLPGYSVLVASGLFFMCFCFPSSSIILLVLAIAVTKKSDETPTT